MFLHLLDFDKTAVFIFVNNCRYAQEKVRASFQDFLTNHQSILSLIFHTAGSRYLSLLTLVLMGLNMNKRQGFNHHITNQKLLSVKYWLAVEHLLSNIFAKISKLLTNFLQTVKFFILRVEQMINKVGAKENEQ